MGAVIKVSAEVISVESSKKSANVISLKNYKEVEIVNQNVVKIVAMKYQFKSISTHFFL